MQFLIVMVLMLAVMYVLMIRPQRQRQAQQQSMIDGANVGDDVLTTGGIYGTISQAEGDDIVVEIASGVTVHMTRRGIAAVPIRYRACATGVSMMACSGSLRVYVEPPGPQAMRRVPTTQRVTFSRFSFLSRSIKAGTARGDFASARASRARNRTLSSVDCRL